MLMDRNCPDSYEILSELLYRYQDQLHAHEKRLSALAATRAADASEAGPYPPVPPASSGAIIAATVILLCPSRQSRGRQMMHLHPRREPVAEPRSIYRSGQH